MIETGRAVETAWRVGDWRRLTIQSVCLFGVSPAPGQLFYTVMHTYHECSALLLWDSGTGLRQKGLTEISGLTKTV